MRFFLLFHHIWVWTFYNFSLGTPVCLTITIVLKHIMILFCIEIQNKDENRFFFKSRIRVTLGPLVRVRFRSNNSIPWVLVITMGVVNTMCPSLYQKSLSIPWVLFNTMSPCQYHESMSIPWVHVYTMSPCQFQELPKGPGGTEGPRGT